MAAPPSLRSRTIARLRAAGCVFAEDEARLLLSATQSPAHLAVLVDRRVSGEPLEHVLGWAEFGGLRIAVGPGVFVPRRRTEFLAHQATALATGTALSMATDPAADRATVTAPAIAVDLCCGSGAIGAVLLAVVAGLELHAVDIDPVAIGYARRNITGRGGRAYVGDLFEPLPARLRGRVDVLVANAPYVPTEAIDLMPPEARAHEPWVALDGGPDGLDVLRRVIAAAPRWLAPDGHLLVETSERQVPALVQTISEARMIARVASSAELAATVVIATYPTSTTD